MLRIWGRTSSINVQKVMWTVAELGLPHERTDAGGAFTSGPRAMSPNHSCTLAFAVATSTSPARTSTALFGP